MLIALDTQPSRVDPALEFPASEKVCTLSKNKQTNTPKKQQQKNAHKTLLVQYVH